jgi:streptogramin lyase
VRGIAGTVRAGKVVTHSTKTKTYNLDMTLGPDGNLWYIGGNSPYVVGKITPNGKVTNYKLPKSYTKKFRGLGHIVSANGALWFSLPGINALAEVTTGGTLSLFPEPVGAQNGPAFLTVSGTTVYAADVGYLKRGHYIGRYTLQPFDTTNDTFGPQLTLTYPTFGAPGPMLPLIFNGGHVWFGSADQANNTSGLGVY